MDRREGTEKMGEPVSVPSIISLTSDTGQEILLSEVEGVVRGVPPSENKHIRTCSNNSRTISLTASRPIGYICRNSALVEPIN